MQNFDGKVAVITGAASGIGRGLAEHAAGLGMQLVLADVAAQPLQALAEHLREQGSECLCVPTDVADAAAVEQLAMRSFQHFSRVDLLFNNAGVLCSGFSWEVSVADWRRQLDINVMGVVHGVHSFMPRLLKQGGPAHIVNTASVAAFLAAPLLGPYTVSKHAVLALSETLLYEMQLLQCQIGVSVLCPGAVVSAIAESDVAVAGSAVRGDAAQAQLQQGLRAGIAAGMSAARCAEIVFAAIAEQRFWIFPHPEFLPVYAASAARRLEGLDPVYQAFEME